MTTPAQSVTVTADKASYAVGDPITVTVEYPDLGDPGTTLTITGAVTAADGSVSSSTTTVQVGAQAPEALPVEVTDSFGDTYAQSSAEPGTAVFTSTIGTPPA